jgi:hypothetical protein
VGGFGGEAQFVYQGVEGGEGDRDGLWGEAIGGGGIGVFEYFIMCA